MRTEFGLSAAQQLAQDDEIKVAIEQSAHRLNRINENYTQILERDMIAWNANLRREQELLRGGVDNQRTANNAHSGQIKDAMNNRRVVEEQKDKIERVFQEAMGKLDPTVEGEDYARSIAELNRRRSQQLASVNELERHLLGAGS